MNNELKPSLKIALAILKINPKAKFDFNGNDIDTIEINWIDETTPISKQDIKNMILVIEQEFNNKEANKQSALNKLKELGLTEEEVKSIL